MPYKHVNYKIQRQHDRRVKLTNADKADIKKLYATGMAIRAIARKYEGKCSRRLIGMVLFPGRRKRVAMLHKELRKDGRYYDRRKHTISIRKHHHHKQRLYLKGQLIPKN